MTDVHNVNMNFDFQLSDFSLHRDIIICGSKEVAIMRQSRKLCLRWIVYIN